MFGKSTDGEFCPILNKDCIKHKCKFYFQIMGRDASTQQDVNEFDCVHNINARLNINLASKVQQATASVDKLNNNMFNFATRRIEPIDNEIKN